MKKNADSNDSGKIVSFPANRHTQPEGTPAKPVAPASPTIPCQDWSTYAPPGVFRAERVRWDLELEFADLTARLEFGPHSCTGVTLTCSRNVLKSLLWRLHQTIAESRSASLYAVPSPRIFFLLRTPDSESPANKSVFRASHTQRLDVRMKYDDGDITLDGRATNGDWFTTILTVEDADALCYDLSRAIARLEHRCPLVP